jgi:hypothetical protein
MNRSAQYQGLGPVAAGREALPMSVLRAVYQSRRLFPSDFMPADIVVNAKIDLLKLTPLPDGPLI